MSLLRTILNLEVIPLMQIGTTLAKSITLYYYKKLKYKYVVDFIVSSLSIGLIHLTPTSHPYIYLYIYYYVIATTFIN